MAIWYQRKNPLAVAGGFFFFNASGPCELAVEASFFHLLLTLVTQNGDFRHWCGYLKA